MTRAIGTVLIPMLCASLAAPAAEKARALPKDLPAYGPLKPLSAPSAKQFTLDNGLQVWLVPRPGFPKVAFVLAVRGGYTADPKDRPGIADLISNVVSQGTKTRSAKQVAEELQAAGGDLGTEAGPDALLLSTSVLSGKDETALRILADVAQNAAFADNEVEIARHNAAANLEANEAEPGFLGTRALYRALFGDNPYAITSPTKESIAKSTAAEMRQEYARRFRPDRSLLVAVGDFDEAALTSAIRSSFSPWKTADQASIAEPAKPKASVNRAVVYVPRGNSVQTTLYVGTVGPTRADSDYQAARLANAIYGGMFGSRLVANIREDKGYTYSPGSRLAPFEKVGVLRTRADVRNEVTGASFNEISYELNRMASTEPEAVELESAKRYLIGTIAIQLQSQAAVARSLAGLWVDHLPPEELERQGQAIEKVSAKEIEGVGKKYYPAWRMTVVAVGDEQVIKDQLSPFGFEFQKSE
jgi:zinc protease